jgi:midasin
MVIVDGLESLPQVAGLSGQSVVSLRHDCLRELSVLAVALPGSEEATLSIDLTVHITPDELRVGGFGVRRGKLASQSSTFRFEAPTTALNAMRVLRGSQLPKAILLEGSPGVGKTSLVSALAAVAGHHLQRINLSDQTDLIDLFGSDLPVEGAQAGEFQWRDAAFLDAMQKGDWVLLDEMNLASQTVLEGLNAVLDHRGTVFIPELGKSFVRHPDFRVFAAQNPLQQGGGRKGLPKSFLNRFTKVYLQEQTAEDLLLICRGLHPMPIELVEKMIAFNEAIRQQTMITRTIGREGSPWEFNLRDLFRWFKLLASPNGLESSQHPVEYLRMVYLHRFRNERDREAVSAVFTDIFDVPVDHIRPAPYITPGWFQIGHSLVARSDNTTIDTRLPPHHLEIAESVLKSVELGWLVILAGDSGIGKRNMVRSIAEAAGRPLGEFAMHPGVDTSEILGSFEQQDIGRLAHHAYASIVELIDEAAELQPALSSHRTALNGAYSALGDASRITSLDEFVSTGRQILGTIGGQIDASRARSALDAVFKAGPNAVGFAWVDGQLLDAIRNGGWFLIFNANLCSASVLDRLNSLCEMNGVLVMSEKGSSTGSPEVIKPHPDFRLFMTYDPRHGELSRAMRNRGVELHMEPNPTEGPVDARTAVHFPLSDHSLLCRLEAYDRASKGAGDSATAVANLVASQSCLSLSLIPRFGSADTEVRAKLFVAASKAAYELLGRRSTPGVLHETFTAALVSSIHDLPPFADPQSLDPSLNESVLVEHPETIFHALQLYLRNSQWSDSLQQWLADPVNAKSVLSVSAASVNRVASRGRVKPGQGVYPFTSLVRQTVQQNLPALLGDDAHLNVSRLLHLDDSSSSLPRSKSTV